MLDQPTARQDEDGCLPRSAEDEAPPDVLWGTWLRYLLCISILEAGRPVTPAELARRLEADGFVVPGRATKTIADALRWEVRRGRVRKVGRGQYEHGLVAKVTLHRMRTRAHVLRAAARERVGAASERSS